MYKETNKQKLIREPFNLQTEWFPYFVKPLYTPYTKYQISIMGFWVNSYVVKLFKMLKYL